jgi:hypothetical protein
LGWHDADIILVGHYLLLRRVLERARSASLGTQALDGTHDISWLSEKRIPCLLGPSQVGIHPLDNVRVMSEGFHAVVPRLVIHFRWIPVALQIARSQHHVGRKSSGWQN